MFNADFLQIRVGDFVRSCLDMDAIMGDDGWFEGTVMDVFDPIDADYVEYMIQRTDGAEGDGDNGEWVIRVNGDNYSFVEIRESLRDRARQMGFGIGDEIDIPDKYKSYESFSGIEWPVKINSISTCDEMDPRNFCDGCPGLVNGLCLGYDDKFIATKYIGEWNEVEN